jgi:hypothetical protein
MPTLSSSLVKHQVASVEDVTDALARQAQYGGDLVTNLLELSTASEERLVAAIAEAHGLDSSTSGELPSASEQIRRLVPGDLASRYGFYPLDERNGVLTVAVSEPLPAEVESDMAFSLGVSVVQRASLLVRIRQALARDYGVPLERRTERILARLAGKPDPSPSLVPPRDIAPAPVRPPTIAPPGTAPSIVEQPPPDSAVPTPRAPPAVVADAVQATAQEAPDTTAPGTPVLPEVTEPKEEPPRVSLPPVVARGPVLRALTRRETQSGQRRRGPYTAAMAEQDLLDATTRDDVLRAFFDFAAQYFEYSALFAVHGDLAEGRDAHGPGASKTKLLSIGVPLDLPSKLSAARESVAPVLVRLGSEGLDGALAKDLERSPGRKVLLLPVRVGSRAVLILYGDHGEVDVELKSVGEVLSVAPLVSAAVERLIIQRKGRLVGALPVAPPMKRRSILPSAEERAQVLAAALEGRVRSEFGEELPLEESPEPATSEAPFVPSPEPPPLEASAPPPPLEVSAPPPPLVEPAKPEESLEPPPLEAPPAPRGPHTIRPSFDVEAIFGASVLPPAGSDTKPAPKNEKPRGRPTVPDLSRTETSISQAPASIAEAISRSAPSHAAPEAPSGFSPEFGTRPGFGSALSARSGTTPPLPTPATPAVTSPDAPATLVTSTPAPPPSAPSSQRLKLVPEQLDTPDYGGEDVSIEAELSDNDIDDAWDYGLDEPPHSRAEVHSARPLAPRGNTSELKLPSVIVDLANEARALLDYLVEGDETAADRLVEMGTAAVTVLVNAFPGPLRHPSLRPGAEPAKASECGPVLKTLYRLGAKSVPFLVVRTNDGDPVVRRWAAHLLGELPAPESTHAVARRFFDTDEAVRRAALAAGRLLLVDPDFGPQLINEFAELAEDRAKGMGMRLASIEALADLRHPLAVPALIRVLADGAPDIEEAARSALVVVARQDFGTQGAAWAEWWRGNGGRHRVEWLIEALTHESQDIRRSAGEELKIVTREYFGYYDDLPARERERAQTRYREWWETRGKARFH